MAKEFDEAVGKITNLRLQKADLGRKIYVEKQGMITNQYLLQDAVNRNQDGGKFQKIIDGHRKNLLTLNDQATALTLNENELVAQLHNMFGSYDNLVNQMNDRYPILFFPVRIETAFSDTAARQLWVRIFPDDIAVDTHEQDLTQSEIEEGKLYWRSFVDANTSQEKGQAWDLLCRSFGAERAAWVALRMQPTTQVPPGDALVFPVLTPKSDSWSKQPVTHIMPDAFVIYAYGNDGSVLTYQTGSIPDELKMGIDPTIDPDDPAADPMSFDQQDIAGRSNELVANPDVNWMINFDAAIASGLGARIPLSASQYSQGFSKVLVLGVKSSLSVDQSKTRLEALINSHHYTDGFSLLKQGTSTNNSDTEFSGYSFVEFGNPTTLKTEREDPLYTPVFTQRQKKDGQLLCEALGIDYEVLYHIFQSNGSDISNSMQVNNLLYQVSFGYTANELMPIFGTRKSNNTELKQFFSEYVRSRGALPSIRSGTQPYGILPASVYSRINWDTDPNAGLYRRIFDYTAALDVHYTRAVASMGSVGARVANASPPSSSPVQQLSDVLTQHAVSTGYVQRVGVGAGYVWNNLEYAATRYPELRQQWMQQQMGRMEQMIAESGLPLSYEHKAVQMNYLQEQSSVTIPLVADANTPLDAPLPGISEAGNMLELLYQASFDQLRDENFEAFGVPDDAVEQQLRQNMLYRFTRQSLMLEYYEAACDLLGISDEQRGEAEFVNILQSSPPTANRSDAFAQQAGPMGNLTYGASRLQVMATPFNGFESVSSFLSFGPAQEFPQTRNLFEAKASLLEISKTNVRDLNLLTAELVDSVSFRLDTWRLALVNQRLNALRGITEGSSNRNTGIYLGAYGWVTDVTPSTDLEAVSPPTQDGQFENGIVHDRNNKGYIHAPSINQAVTGAVMLSGYSERARSNMEDPMSVNLSSERVRAALDILEAIRNGQNLEVLLGYEFERRLRDLHPSDDVNLPISGLRKQYPVQSFVVEITPDPAIVDLIKARNAVSGSGLVEVYKTSGMTPILAAAGVTAGSQLALDIQAAVKWIWDLMDAVGDIAMSEGMFHVVQGNPVKGGAVAEAISKGNLVAEPDVVNSIKTGLEVGQRFTMHFDTSHPVLPLNQWADMGDGSVRRGAEPYVNRWLSELLPVPSSILCRVVPNDEAQSFMVSPEDLGLQPIDLMYLVGEELNNDDSILSLMIKKYVRTVYGLNRDTVLEIFYHTKLSGNQLSFKQVHPVLLYARKVITNARPLDTYDYMLPGDAAEGVLKLYNTEELEERYNQLRGDLETTTTTLGDVLNATFDFTATINALFALSGFGIEQTVYEFVNDTTEEDENTLKAWGQSVLKIAQQRLADSVLAVSPPAPGEDPVPYVNRVVECMKAILGNGFAVLPLFGIRPDEQAYLAQMVNGGTNSLLLDNGNADNDLLMDEWLSSIARVRKNAANFEMLSILGSAINFDAFESRPLIPLQMPYAADNSERWLGAAIDPDQPGGLKEGRIAIGASMPADNTVDIDQVGILVDNWIDVIPYKEQTSGISFHHNQPNAKAPQCLLLGLTPKITGNWRWDDLVDMMNETFELVKKRAVDYERISSSVVGQLPAIAMPFTRTGNVIGLSAAHLLSVNP